MGRRRVARNAEDVPAPSPPKRAISAHWSHQTQLGSLSDIEPASWTTLVLIASIAAVVFQEVAEPWISMEGPWKAGRNGPVLSFLKSVHSINHYWYKARFVSRSLVGCLVLKFVGPFVFSVCVGRSGAHLPSPEQLASFLAAFALVRSDCVEASRLSGHMRYTSGCTVALNLMAALYKLRKFLSLVEKSPVLGLPTVLTVGTLALSACNLCMVAEQALFSLPQLRRYMGAPLVSAAADAEEREPVYPRFGATIRRHLFFLLILLLGHWGSTTYESTLLRHAYLASQMVVLGLLFSTYNEGLLMEHQAASGSSDVRAQARAPPSGNGKAGSGADATDHPSSPSAAKKGSPRSSAVRAWLGVSPLWAWGTIAAATYSAGRVQVSASSSQLTASVRQK